MIALILAHPYLRRSRACRAVIDAVSGQPGLELRALYELYPDFAIDIEAERTALLASRLVVWLHPLDWYNVPGLLKLWFDTVLGAGWAYGASGKALAGKDCLWVPTAGAPFSNGSASEPIGEAFSEFEPAIRRTALFCGMNWLAPQAIRLAGEASREQWQAAGLAVRQRLIEWATDRG